MLSGLEYSGRLDAEYYRPQWLTYENLLHKRNCKRLSSAADFLIGPFGSAFTVENYTNDKSFRYIRGKDVKPMQLMDNDNVYMPQADFERLSKYALRKDDILISVVGTVGNAAIIEEDNLPAIFSCKSTVVRVNDINPYYLLTYLNSKFGQSLLRRKERGAVQQGLNLDDLRRLAFYKAELIFQDAICEKYKLANILKKNSDISYSRAEQILLKTLELMHFSKNVDNINIKLLSNSFGKNGRLDAEYFQPKYDQLLVLLGKDGLTIGDVAPARHERFENLKSGNFHYIEIGGMRGDGTVASETVPCVEAPSRASQQVRSGDILTSTVRPIRRLSAVILEDQDNHVCSSGFVVLEPKQIVAEVLLVYLRLPIICELMDLHTSASLYPAISEKDFLSLPIPKISISIQNDIAVLVRKSLTLKSQSKHLLEAAKRAVEIAIEQDEAAGMAYLSSEGALA